MVYDIQLIERLFGKAAFTLTINDENGDPDDLTAYTTVRLVISLTDRSAVAARNHTQSDAEITITALGKLTYTPSTGNPVPGSGVYDVEVFRESVSEHLPVKKFSLLIIREARIT